jgi:hypothetical protein
VAQCLCKPREWAWQRPSAHEADGIEARAAVVGSRIAPGDAGTVVGRTSLVPAAEGNPDGGNPSAAGEGPGNALHSPSAVDADGPVNEMAPTLGIGSEAQSPRLGGPCRDLESGSGSPFRTYEMARGGRFLSRGAKEKIINGRSVTIVIREA